MNRVADKFWLCIQCSAFLLLIATDIIGVSGFSLSSSPSYEDGQVTVCPDTTITLTCTAGHVEILTWIQEPDQQLRLFVPADYESEERRVIERGPYTLTLVAVDNVNGSFADFTSTLEVMVDDIEDETTIACDVFDDEDQLTISITSPPSPPSNVMVVEGDYETDNFSITISWEESGSVVDEYRIQTNTTTQSDISTTTTTVVLEGEYNVPLEIRVSAINCAGSSAEVTEHVIVAGCGPPSPPVNGSVGEWTSSRVGAQVNYSCDTDLVLVGERVAYCSLPQLQWLPSSDDVVCVQPPPVSSTAILKSTSVTVIPSTTAPSSTPSNTDSNSGPGVPIAVGVVVPLVLAGVIVFTLILLFIIYKKRRNRWKPSPWNGGQELRQLTSSTGTVSTPHSPNSPLAPATVSPGPQFTVSPGPRAAVYSDVNRNGDTTSGNGTTPTVIYSETTESRRTVRVSQDAHGVATSHQVTTVDATQYATAGHRDTTSPPRVPPEEKYAQLTFKESLPPLPSLEAPVQYSSVRVSASSPPDACEGAQQEEAAGVVGGGGKHPLDLAITIDSVIQQLQLLIPYWWAVGEAAGLQRPVLKEIASHFKGNERESFAEVMNQVFVPGKTTWTQLAGVCEGAGFTDLASALLDSYSTGVLPVQVEEDDTLLRRTPTQPPPPVPPRGADEDNEEDPPPSLPPPLAPEDVPLPVPPRHPLSADAAPPRPPKVSKPPAVPPRY